MFALISPESWRARQAWWQKAFGIPDCASYINIEQHNKSETKNMFREFQDNKTLSQAFKNHNANHIFTRFNVIWANYALYA